MKPKPDFCYRRIEINDEEKIFRLYKKSSEVKEGLARAPEEITNKYIKEYISNTINKGLGIIILDENQVEVAVLLSYKNEPKTFTPTIGNMSLAVNPDFIGYGVGKKIFTYYINEITNNFPEIQRIELNVRQTNQRAIDIYKSVGFVVEGVMKNRLLDSNSKLSDDTFMAWYRG